MKAKRPEQIAYLAFTDRGEALAETIQNALCGKESVRNPQSCADGRAPALKTCETGSGMVFRTGNGVTADGFTRDAFSSRDALVFVGAAGIAVRAIAPYLKDKTTDPAVIAVDETGQYVIPLLSGHLGGANALARRIADAIGAEAVITTATDANGVFAVDEWARVQGFALKNPGRIKAVSGALLNGKTVTVYSAFPVDGKAPEGIRLVTSGCSLKEAADRTVPDVCVDVYIRKDSLCLVPPVLALGIGCRRGVTEETLEEQFALFCTERGIYPEAVACAASIDKKADEAGLLSFCGAHGWEIRFYTAKELETAPGGYTASAFVERTVGVDNVCERSAVLAAGGMLTEKKYGSEGVTFALAKAPFRTDWRYRDG